MTQTFQTKFRRNQSRFLEKYGPWAVVTGASDGIGRELALRLGEAGFNLVLVARRQTLLNELSTQLVSRCGIEVKVLSLDLAEPEATGTIARATQTINVGLLVAAAGFGTSGRFIETPVEAELAMIDVNCRAVVGLSSHFARRFADQKRGGIILLSSLLAFQGVPKAANYAATKAFVQTLAEGLRLELQPFGVDVLAVAPGPIQSGFASRANMQMGMAQTPKDVAQATLNALGRTSTVRPGWLSKLLEGSLWPLPRWARSRILGIVMAGMTQHHENGKNGKTQSERSLC